PAERGRARLRSGAPIGLDQAKAQMSPRPPTRTSGRVLPRRRARLPLLDRTPPTKDDAIGALCYSMWARHAHDHAPAEPARGALIARSIDSRQRKDMLTSPCEPFWATRAVRIIWLNIFRRRADTRERQNTSGADPAQRSPVHMKAAAGHA